MNSRELMHAWAHQTRPHRTAGNVKFTGPALYSYSTIIGRIYTRNARRQVGESGLDTGARERFVLLSERRYSSTTAKHLNYAASAVSHLSTVRVPHVTTHRYEDRAPTREQHRANFDFLVAEAARMLKEAQRVQRMHGVEWRVVCARQHLNSAADYSAFFGLRWKAPAFPHLEWTNAQIRAERIANPNLAFLDKRERARAKRVERKAEQDRLKVERATIANNALRTDWRLGGAFGVAHHSGRTFGPVMLRVNGDQIETSLGACVPIADARHVWQLIEAVRASGFPRSRGLSRVLQGVEIGGYGVDAIDADGTLKAGCHTIPYSELRAMARTLGLIERGQR